MTIQSSHRLTVPANRTVSGPHFHKQDNRLIVEYDCEKDDGGVEWSQIAFDDVLAFEYRQEACCRGTDVVDPYEIRVVDESMYLSDLLEYWKKSVGWQDWQQQKGGMVRYKHFSAYFDGAGSIHVIAATVTLE